ncbi:acyl-CoA dehydrogenase [Nocardioides sp. S5]|uniref:acyl-CoA dehydrogenase family protein n=1 Tax=Nocardioides sp. S5 TaxID=2017486 RepID=UPI001A8D535B|nr:acyl-CoA dehydrogenase family protein [Nocardioides sp. S5]QSR32211.1 acyl-CoA dehydrogenase [Nocardioides sp. S5]
MVEWSHRAVDKELVEATREVCKDFSLDYWRECDQNSRYPEEFFRAAGEAGWLGALLPTKYGGTELGLPRMVDVLETITRSGAGMTGGITVNQALFPIQPLLRFGTEAQREKYLPLVATGDLHVAFAVTEPDAGIDTSRITTRAVLTGERYTVNGQKVYISKAQRADRIVLLTRTMAREAVSKPTDGMTLLFAENNRSAISIHPMDKLGTGAIDTNTMFIDGLEVDASDRIGDESDGFTALTAGLNAERIVLSAEALGTGMAAIDAAVKYAGERVVFGRPIGQNQGIQFPLAEAYGAIEAARGLTREAAEAYEAGAPNTAVTANLALLTAARAAFQACDSALQVHGGAGYMKDFHIERLWREVRLVQLAPVSQEMIKNFLAQRVLGLPRAY